MNEQPRVPVDVRRGAAGQVRETDAEVTLHVLVHLGRYFELGWTFLAVILLF